tara:strand:- start:16119 stop:16772 length:654 start_codon:yes stop_codon:yes gene_type:complete
LEKKLNLNKLSKKEWKDNYTSYVNLKPSNSEKIYALRKISLFLDSICNNYFISVGTCLGIFRDNEIIPWDDDIDLDIIDKNYDQIHKLIIEFAEKNNFPYKIGPNIFHPKINIFINKVKVSIGKLTIGYFNKKMLYRPKTKVPLAYIYPTKPLKFKDINLRIPYNPELYLKHIYGTNWRKPIKWNGKDQYRSHYERKGLIYYFLEQIQNFISTYKYN